VTVQDAPAALVRELEAIEAQLAETYKNHDCAAWGGMLADEWTVTHITAEIITKQQALEMCGKAPEITSTYEQLSVRSYGTMAIVTGINNATALNQTIRLRFTDVFIRRNNRWVVAMSHATRIPD
jgi:hypothetical protein